MESSIAEFLERQLASELLPTKETANPQIGDVLLPSGSAAPSCSSANCFVTLSKASACSRPAVERFYTELARRAYLPSQRSLHSAPIFRLLLKVAVNGTHQCDSNNFCGASSSNNKLMPTDHEGSVRQLGNAGGNIVDCRCSCQAPLLQGKNEDPHLTCCYALGALLTRFCLRLEDTQPASVTHCSTQAALFPLFG